MYVAGSKRREVYVSTVVAFQCMSTCVCVKTLLCKIKINSG